MGGGTEGMYWINTNLNGGINKDSPLYFRIKCTSIINTHLHIIGAKMPCSTYYHTEHRKIEIK